MDETLHLGVEKTEGEEDEVVSASYVRQDAADGKEHDHLPEGKTLVPVEPWRGNPHEE